MKTLNLRLDDDVHAMLVAQAEREDRSLNWWMQQLIRSEQQRQEGGGS